jgi:hypothetical protein
MGTLPMAAQPKGAISLLRHPQVKIKILPMI